MKRKRRDANSDGDSAPCSRQTANQLSRNLLRPNLESVSWRPGAADSQCERGRKEVLLRLRSRVANQRLHARTVATKRTWTTHVFSLACCPCRNGPTAWNLTAFPVLPSRAERRRTWRGLAPYVPRLKRSVFDGPGNRHVSGTIGRSIV